MGSSPLARGTLFLQSVSSVAEGLIPARAGNTPPGRSRPEIVRAHPRSRGEHTESCTALVMTLGSSPLARGTLGDAVEEIARMGLIPARAGNTDSFSFRFGL